MVDAAFLALSFVLLWCHLGPRRVRILDAGQRRIERRKGPEAAEKWRKSMSAAFWPWTFTYVLLAATGVLLLTGRFL